MELCRCSAIRSTSHDEEDAALRVVLVDSATSGCDAELGTGWVARDADASVQVE